jgi:hypothetical protein
MTINERYGLPPLSKQVYTPTTDFPEAFRKQLLKALGELAGLWSKMDVDAFRRGDVVYLRVTLDVGDRPLHLYLHQDGDVLQFDAPVMFDFPAGASHFVLTELCGSTTNLSFRVDEKDVLLGEGGTDRKPSVSKTEVLYGWGRFEFETFTNTAHTLLPFLVAKLTQAEKELRAFREMQIVVGD